MYWYDTDIHRFASEFKSSIRQLLETSRDGISVSIGNSSKRDPDQDIFMDFSDDIAAYTFNLSTSITPTFAAMHKVFLFLFENALFLYLAHLQVFLKEEPLYHLLESTSRERKDEEDRRSREMDRRFEQEDRERRGEDRRDETDTYYSPGGRSLSSSSSSSAMQYNPHHYAHQGQLQSQYMMMHTPIAHSRYSASPNSSSFSSLQHGAVFQTPQSPSSPTRTYSGGERYSMRMMRTTSGDYTSPPSLTSNSVFATGSFMHRRQTSSGSVTSGLTSPSNQGYPGQLNHKYGSGYGLHKHSYSFSAGVLDSPKPCMYDQPPREVTEISKEVTSKVLGPIIGASDSQFTLVMVDNSIKTLETCLEKLHLFNQNLSDFKARLDKDYSSTSSSSSSSQSCFTQADSPFFFIHQLHEKLQNEEDALAAIVRRDFHVLVELKNSIEANTAVMQ
jgi:hypothetical protein